MSNDSELRQRQQQMMAFLLGQSDDIAPHIVGDQQVSAAERLSIYRNAYRIRLREVIDTDHPVLGTYLGDDLFDRMVDGYIDSMPSQFRSLRQYCDPLPEFLRTDEFFAQYPQISELARFERFLLVAFDAADRLPATVQDLQELPPEQWPAMTLRFHPSLQMFITPYNIVEIWQSLKAENAPPELMEQNSCWVLWRNADRLTEFRSISRVEQQMLDAFLQGHNLTQVAEIIVEQEGHDSAAESLLTIMMQWLELGWVQQLVTESDNPDLSLI